MLQGVLSCLVGAMLLSCCGGAPAPVILPDAITNFAFTAAGGTKYNIRHLIPKIQFLKIIISILFEDDKRAKKIISINNQLLFSA